MGCVSSTPKDDPVPPQNNQQQPASEGENSPQEVTKQAQKQRRRLSVAPTHVGDISKAVQLANGENDNNTDNAGLSANEIQAKGQLKVELKSKKGFVPYNKNKVNQDRGIIKFALADDPSVSLFGVMDGHGEFGHHVAQFVQDRLPFYLGQQKDLKSDPSKYIFHAVALLVDELSNSNINVTFSGTTCVFGVKIDDILYVANIGDSRCILIRKNMSGGIDAIPLSVDQKPEVPSEKQRIIEAGGRVEPLRGLPGEDCGPPRVWLSEVDVPGLAMSRSIGDEVSQTVGVISVPEIITHHIEDSDLFVVWASDGVWEFVSNEKAASIIYKHANNLPKAVECLVDESDKHWRQEEEVVDDITCVCVQLNPI